ncbi:type II toxin-antitoxin system RelE/ParE family toxin [Peteryoungia ipomoeae]|uniref:Type II toxin-antitoxin system RelE/ParE family toxin n=1 Tax=Peteryoungia ipomoeae TaxID=1210932 RepID=A0A4S8NZU3_9HYPH|nr:type II toxin-antitoxin system RelE/ParE family toxin [Peteryoungia ipomoeae]THV23168.1 type II toxin-antitoxin system RelE/ParE family toxin [Peteryoungia ipomoeae]
MKRFVFVNEAAKRAFLDLPKEMQRQFGADLQAVQRGEPPFSRWKHLTESVGPGAIELIENAANAYRAIYCAKFSDTVYILHAFTKTTNGVDWHAMKTASERYKLMMSSVSGKR